MFTPPQPQRPGLPYDLPAPFTNNHSHNARQQHSRAPPSSSPSTLHPPALSTSVVHRFLSGFSASPCHQHSLISLYPSTLLHPYISLVSSIASFPVPSFPFLSLSHISPFCHLYPLLPLHLPTTCMHPFRFIFLPSYITTSLVSFITYFAVPSSPFLYLSPFSLTLLSSLSTSTSSSPFFFFSSFPSLPFFFSQFSHPLSLPLTSCFSVSYSSFTPILYFLSFSFTTFNLHLHPMPFNLHPLFTLLHLLIPALHLSSLRSNFFSSFSPPAHCLYKRFPCPSIPPPHVDTNNLRISSHQRICKHSPPQTKEKISNRYFGLKNVTSIRE